MQSNSPKHPTPPGAPTVDFDGHRIEGVTFFKQPRAIGTLIAGFSEIKDTAKPVSARTRLRDGLIFAAVGLAIGCGLYFGLKPEGLGYQVACFAVPTLAGWLAAFFLNHYGGYNYFLGEQGFAYVGCHQRVDNLLDDVEVGFSQVTDLHTYLVERYTNAVYQGTAFTYIWLNCESRVVLAKVEGEYDKRKASAEYPPKYRLMLAAEQEWTKRKMEGLRETIRQDGHLTFRLIRGSGPKTEEFVRMAPGKITFIKSKGEEFTYLSSDIQSVTTSPSSLVIRHKNFERVMVLFRKGNEDHVPLEALCNRKFFLLAFEQLMGYKL